MFLSMLSWPVRALRQGHNLTFFASVTQLSLPPFDYECVVISISQIVE